MVGVDFVRWPDSQVGAAQHLCLWTLAGVLTDGSEGTGRRDTHEGWQQGEGEGETGPLQLHLGHIYTRFRYRQALLWSLAMSELPENFQTAPLSEVDPEIATVLEGELRRQQGTLEMIASENFVPQAVLDAVGSVLTNKYAEGYPGRRYYGGCEEVDVAEQLAIDRAKELFGAEHANVQPHAGAQANNAAYMALIEPGDTIMGLALDHGGHLTHGMKLNVSGKLYNVVAYHVSKKDLRVDMEEVERLAAEHRPKLIVAGWSAYPRQLDFAAFRQIADSVGAKLMVDMAHFAGLVAAGEHPNPVPHADVVTTTIHKTLAGPRSGMILSTEEQAKAIDKAIFPGQQGGPLMHTIAAKAVALRIAASEPFRARQRQTIANAQAFAAGLEANGVPVLTGGTDVHLVLVDLTPSGLDGQTAEDRLEAVGITVNRNAIPFDPRPPMNPSGLRIGTPALTTRGLVEDDMTEIAAVIATALSGEFDTQKEILAERTRNLMDRYPLYPQLASVIV
ncbi:MAG: glycine hydroxymethyltransferase [Solirubrobacterales bacterium]|jgi:glycine hydroxymethyltransferase|nr:glycine hydroxymethyltransferase [Solirubrobacterales bacterium]